MKGNFFILLGQKSVSRGNIGTMNKLGMNGGKNNGRVLRKMSLKELKIEMTRKKNS